VVLVTHEDDISHFAHRIIRLRDGMVESDKQNANPATIAQPV
jgi:putative ABC transport system ATP-binding protein